MTAIRIVSLPECFSATVQLDVSAVKTGADEPLVCRQP